MSRTPLQHMAISASAGSGKTFQLAHRYIRLLADGTPADRICALTFSRKAAGEIFDEIVKYLVQASSSPQGAATISHHANITSILLSPSPSAPLREIPPSPSSYLELLRRFLTALHRLHIGTLDSFIVGVLRAFPMELGVAPEFNVMNGDGAANTELRARVLRNLFSEGGLDPHAQQAFLEAYKRATFGREEKSAFERLDGFISDFRTLYREIPDENAWGQPAAIWPDGPPWPPTPNPQHPEPRTLNPAPSPPPTSTSSSPPIFNLQSSINNIADALRAHAVTARWDAKVITRWETFLQFAAAFSPYGAWPKELSYLFEKLSAALPDLQRGAADLTLDKKPCALDADACRLALAAMRHIIATELNARLESTAGLYQILARYEGAYDAWSRRAGTMSFTDAQYLLTAANRQSGGMVLSREPNTEGRLYIDYRLDARLDHWLLDEFQDTSNLQWAAIRNLVDEILQSQDGTRSFFYVGDVKQAIYGWRGGNPKLFSNILDAYPKRITPSLLSVSFRSCLPVLDFVNAVFNTISTAGLPENTGAHWKKIWNPHEPWPEGRTLPGYAALLEPPTDGKTKPSDTDRYQLAAAIIRELDPVAQNLSVALLVRTNDHGLDLVDVLRRECHNLPIVHEGHAPLKDNPVVSLMLALIRFALHPGDSLAWRHLQMSPLFPDVAQIDDLPTHLLRDMQTRGFHEFLRHWGAALNQRVPLDAFGQRRLQDLLAAASEFDATGSRDAAAFLRFLEEYQIAESATGQAVRVMTIHQSKGLGFDVVILPDLQGRAMDRAHDVDIAAPRDAADKTPRWVLRMPRKPVAECDPVLSAALREADDAASFGELCVLYVALTRAKRAMYCISSYAGPTSTSLSPAALLKKQLTHDPKTHTGQATTYSNTPATTLHESGTRTWFTTLQTPSPQHPAPSTSSPPPIFNLQSSIDNPPPPSSLIPHPSSLTLIEPSAHESPIFRPAARLFDREFRTVLDFGKQIHALFEHIEWLDPSSDPQTLNPEPTTSFPETRRDVANQFRTCLQNADVRTLFTRPPGNIDLWREQRFELLLEKDEWVRGVFDRVVITRDASGRPTHAAIIDFKSDRIADESQFTRTAEGYRSQLNLYARAASRILNIPLANISLTLIFTRAPRIWTLNPPSTTTNA